MHISLYYLTQVVKAMTQGVEDIKRENSVVALSGDRRRQEIEFKKIAIKSLISFLIPLFQESQYRLRPQPKTQ